MRIVLPVRRPRVSVGASQKNEKTSRNREKSGPRRPQGRSQVYDSGEPCGPRPTTKPSGLPDAAVQAEERQPAGSHDFPGQTLISAPFLAQAEVSVTTAQHTAQAEGQSRAEPALGTRQRQRPRTMDTKAAAADPAKEVRRGGPMGGEVSKMKVDQAASESMSAKAFEASTGPIRRKPHLRELDLEVPWELRQRSPNPRPPLCISNVEHLRSLRFRSHFGSRHLILDEPLGKAGRV